MEAGGGQDRRRAPDTAALAGGQWRRKPRPGMETVPILHRGAAIPSLQDQVIKQVNKVVALLKSGGAPPLSGGRSSGRGDSAQPSFLGPRASS